MRRVALRLIDQRLAHQVVRAIRLLLNAVNLGGPQYVLIRSVVVLTQPLPVRSDILKRRRVVQVLRRQQVVGCVLLRRQLVLELQIHLRCCILLVDVPLISLVINRRVLRRLIKVPPYVARGVVIRERRIVEYQRRVFI